MLDDTLVSDEALEGCDALVALVHSGEVSSVPIADSSIIRLSPASRQANVRPFCFVLLPVQEDCLHHVQTGWPGALDDAGVSVRVLLDLRSPNDAV